MTHRSVPALGAISLLLCACMSEEPYVLTDYRAHQLGYVKVCYSDDAVRPGQIQDLAEDICARYHRTAKKKMVQADQCSWLAPNLALFTCEARPGDVPTPLVQRKAPLRHDESIGSPY